MCAVAADNRPRSINDCVVVPYSRYPVSAQRPSSVENTTQCGYEMGSRLTASEVKVDCGKDTNWLLFRSAQLERFSQ